MSQNGQNSPWGGAYQGQPGNSHQPQSGSSNVPAVWQPQQQYNPGPVGQQPYAQQPVPFAQSPFQGQGGPTYVMPLKSDGTAYLLWFFLGGFSAHNWYLGNTGQAVGQLSLYLLGWFTIWFFGLGMLFWFPLGIWLIVDLFMIPGFVRQANARLTGFQQPY